MSRGGNRRSSRRRLSAIVLVSVWVTGCLSVDGVASAKVSGATLATSTPPSDHVEPLLAVRRDLGRAPRTRCLRSARRAPRVAPTQLSWRHSRPSDAARLGRCSRWRTPEVTAAPAIALASAPPVRPSTNPRQGAAWSSPSAFAASGPRPGLLNVVSTISWVLRAHEAAARAALGHSSRANLEDMPREVATGRASYRNQRRLWCRVTLGSGSNETVGRHRAGLLDPLDWAAGHTKSTATHHRLQSRVATACLSHSCRHTRSHPVYRATSRPAPRSLKRDSRHDALVGGLQILCAIATIAKSSTSMRPLVITLSMCSSNLSIKADVKSDRVL